MVSHICLSIELGPICNFGAASLCLKGCDDQSLLNSYNGGLWKNNYMSGAYTESTECTHDFICSHGSHAASL